MALEARRFHKVRQGRGFYERIGRNASDLDLPSAGAEALGAPSGEQVALPLVPVQ